MAISLVLLKRVLLTSWSRKISETLSMSLLMLLIKRKTKTICAIVSTFSRQTLLTRDHPNKSRRRLNRRSKWKLSRGKAPTRHRLQASFCLDVREPSWRTESSHSAIRHSIRISGTYSTLRPLANLTLNFRLSSGQPMVLSSLITRSTSTGEMLVAKRVSYFTEMCSK